MSLVTLSDILPEARASGKAIGAFNVANYETAVSVIMAAEAEQSPVIVQVYQRLLSDPYFPAMAAMLRTLAENSRVPVVLHLDHGASLDQIRQAISLGFSSVMFDASRLPLPENIAMTQQAVALAEKAGVSIEAEIGHVPANDREPTPYSDPDEVEQFVRETAVDALAVAVGTAHGFYRTPPKISVEIASEIGKRVSVPLVLHGGSDTPLDKVRAVIGAGMAKVNVATEFQYRFEQNLKQQLITLDQKFQPIDLLMKPVVQSATDQLRQMIRFFANVS